MRASIQPTLLNNAFPLLEASDLPGEEDWFVVESFHCDSAQEFDDDRYATFSVASLDD